MTVNTRDEDRKMVTTGKECTTRDVDREGGREEEERDVGSKRQTSDVPRE